MLRSFVTATRRMSSARRPTDLAVSAIRLRTCAMCVGIECMLLMYTASQFNHELRHESRKRRGDPLSGVILYGDLDMDIRRLGSAEWRVRLIHGHHRAPRIQ